MREEMEEKMRRRLEDVTSNIEKKLVKKSNNVIAKIHGLESPRSTFDGTLTQYKDFANELRQWCAIYGIEGEQALIIMGQRLKGNAKALWVAVDKNPIALQ